MNRLQNCYMLLKTINPPICDRRCLIGFINTAINLTTEIQKHLITSYGEEKATADDLQTYMSSLFDVYDRDFGKQVYNQHIWLLLNQIFLSLESCGSNIVNLRCTGNNYGRKDLHTAQTVSTNTSMLVGYMAQRMLEQEMPTNLSSTQLITDCAIHAIGLNHGSELCAYLNTVKPRIPDTSSNYSAIMNAINHKRSGLSAYIKSWYPRTS